MRAAKYNSRANDHDTSARMSIDFGKEDVADLASFQDMVTYSDMLELEYSQHDTQSESEQGRLHASNTL
jgi:hypothetical protein